ncbi:MAG: hypothetical protein AB7S75_21315 [Desulfococcaceae bacterium]
MYFDIKTPEKQEQAARAYRQYLLTELNAAIRMDKLLNCHERQQAGEAVDAISRIRHSLYQKAEQMGYAAACAKSIPDCRGECCKWHFPANLDCIDLFICIFPLSPEKHKALQERLSLDDNRYQCPFLNPDGCIFSFDSRPLVCAIAWPCFMSDSYHAFMEKELKKIKEYYRILKDLSQIFQEPAVSGT